MAAALGESIFLTFTVGDEWSVFFVSLHAKDQKVRG